MISSIFYELVEKLDSPYINRFLSADTIVPGYANPQNLNRYSYVTNNPLRYTDPTGHERLQDGPVDEDFSQSVFDEYEPLPDNDDGDENDGTTPQSPHSNTEGGESISSLFPSSDAWDSFWDGQYTPLYFALAQEFFAGTQEVGEAIIAFGVTTVNPIVGIVGAGVYVSSWAFGRVSGGLGTYSTIRQYYKNLNGTNGTDVYMSVGTSVAGIYPPVSSTSSTVNLLYTAYRTGGGTIFEIPFLPRR